MQAIGPQLNGSSCLMECPFSNLHSSMFPIANVFPSIEILGCLDLPCFISLGSSGICRCAIRKLHSMHSASLRYTRNPTICWGFCRVHHKVKPLIRDVNLQYTVMVSVMSDCNNSRDALRNGLVLALLQKIHGVRNVNEDGKIDLWRKTRALIFGDVRIVCGQLWKRGDEDSIVPICCIGNWSHVIFIANLDEWLMMRKSAIRTSQPWPKEFKFLTWTQCLV